MLLHKLLQVHKAHTHTHTHTNTPVRHKRMCNPHKHMHTRVLHPPAGLACIVSTWSKRQLTHSAGSPTALLPCLQLKHTHTHTYKHTLFKGTYKGGITPAPGVLILSESKADPRAAFHLRVSDNAVTGITSTHLFRSQCLARQHICDHPDVLLLFIYVFYYLSNHLKKGSFGISSSNNERQWMRTKVQFSFSHPLIEAAQIEKVASTLTAWASLRLDERMKSINLWIDCSLWTTSYVKEREVRKHLVIAGETLIRKFRLLLNSRIEAVIYRIVKWYQTFPYIISGDVWGGWASPTVGGG